jgi:hypothetical protein
MDDVFDYLSNMRVVFSGERDDPLSLARSITVCPCEILSSLWTL